MHRSICSPRPDTTGSSLIIFPATQFESPGANRPSLHIYTHAVNWAARAEAAALRPIEPLQNRMFATAIGLNGKMLPIRLYVYRSEIVCLSTLCALLLSAVPRLPAIVFMAIHFVIYWFRMCCTGIPAKRNWTLSKVWGMRLWPSLNLWLAHLAMGHVLCRWQRVFHTGEMIYRHRATCRYVYMYV